MNASLQTHQSIYISGVHHGSTYIRSCWNGRCGHPHASRGISGRSVSSARRGARPSGVKCRQRSRRCCARNSRPRAAASPHGAMPSEARRSATRPQFVRSVRPQKPRRSGRAGSEARPSGRTGRPDAGPATWQRKGRGGSGRGRPIARANCPCFVTVTRAIREGWLSAAANGPENGPS